MSGVRALALADIEALQQMDERQHGHAWSYRTFVDDIEQDNRVHLVLESDDEIVGHAGAWIDGPSCRVTNVAVSHTQAGNGYDSILLLSLLRRALAEPHVANVQLEVRPSNRRAQQLYSRFGFLPAGIERNFYDRSDDRGSRDAIVMAVPDVCEDAWRDRLDQIEQAVHDKILLQGEANDAGAAA